MRLAPGPSANSRCVVHFFWPPARPSQYPREPIPDLVPDLAIEVISRRNTRQEMDRKLRDYFTAGVRLVWSFITLRGGGLGVRQPDGIHGGPGRRNARRRAVLPGFRVALADLFAEPA